MAVGAQPFPIASPAMASLITQSLNVNRQADQKFVLLILPEDNWPRCEEFDVVQQLVARIKELLGTPCCLHAFLGHRLNITAGPHRFLTTPMGSLPLFDLPEPERAPLAEFGWVGADMDTPQAPLTDTEEPEYEEPDQLIVEAAQDDPLVTGPTGNNETPMF